MADSLLLGWPFEDNPPIKYGEVEGIPWAVARGGAETMPTVNGYARIPWEGHPWSGIADRDELPVQVHGDLTWGPHPGGGNRQRLPARTFGDVGGWVGFDTGHAWDVWSDEALAEAGVTRKHLPELDDLLRKPIFGDYQIDWTVERVVAEAQNLAHQIAQAAVTGPRDDDAKLKKRRRR